MRRWQGLFFIGSLFFCSVLSAAESSAGKTLFEVLEYGKEINLVLGVFAFVAFFLVFVFLLLTRRALTVPSAVLRQLLDDLASGDVESAAGRLQNNRSLIARTVLPGLKLFSHPLERIQTAMEGAGRRALGRHRQNVTLLSNIGTLAPMLGLLGTVLGLLKAFNVMASDSIGEGSRTLAMTGAIGEAMGTTAVGLVVGIFAMMMHFLCLSRLNRIGDEVETAAEDVAAALGELKQQ